MGGPAAQAACGGPGVPAWGGKRRQRPRAPGWGEVPRQAVREPEARGKRGRAGRATGPHSGWGEKGWLCECAFAHLHVCVHASGSDNRVPGLPTHHPLSVLGARPWAAAGGSEMGPGGPAPGEGGPLGARVLCHRRWRVRVSTPVGTHGPACPLGLGGAGLGGRHSPSSGSGSSLKGLPAGPGGNTSV